MIENLAAGALAGAAYGIVGFARNKPYEDFDWTNFGITVVGSAIIGGYASYSGLAIDLAASSAIGVVITQAVKKGYDILKDYLERKKYDTI